jgi:hypothetical protein
MTKTKMAGVVLSSLLAAGCAGEGPDSKLTTQSLKQHRTTQASTSNEKLKAFCAQRHLDHQEGRSPGGAKSLEQKMADDRACATLNM